MRICLKEMCLAYRAYYQHQKEFLVKELIKEPKTSSAIDEYMQKLIEVSHKKLNLLLNEIARSTHSYKIHSVYDYLNNTIAVS